LERSDLSQTAGAAGCVEVWRLKNVSKYGAGGRHKIANQLRLSIYTIIILAPLFPEVLVI